jgi:hypothetical protein
MKTTTTTNGPNLTHYHLLTLSVPVENKNKNGFLSSIVSSICLKEIKINKIEILRRMYVLNIKKITVVLISDQIIEASGIAEVINLNDPTFPDFTLTFELTNTDSFFSYKGFEYFFGIKRNHNNYENIYAIEGKT